MKELQVHYHGLGEPFLVGTLAEDTKDVLFQYSAQALERGIELSPLRLALRPLAYPDRQTDYAKLHAVPGLICDSLPDAWGYRLMDRHLRSRGIDPGRITALDRLAYLSANTMGALTYAPAMTAAQDTQALTLLELAQEVQTVHADDGHKVLAELARAGGSPGGARPKANVFFNPATGQISTQAALVPDAEPWLVKFPSDDDEADSCALEELYAVMARVCQLGMMATRYFKLPNGHSAFATARFDRRGAQRVHVHSLAGLLHANFQEPSVSYEDFFRVTRRLTRDQRQLKKAVQRCVFNVLMNNRDDHSKNLSFLMEADGSWHLAPPYDLTYCPGYQGEHFMDVAGEGRAPTRQHVLKAAETAGLPRGAAESAIDEILAVVTPATLLENAEGLALRKSTVTKVHQALQTNFARLLS